MDADFTEEYTYEVSPRDSEIAKSLKFVNYQSPTDSVSVSIPPPPIPFGNGPENSGNGRGGAEAQEEVAESLRCRREALRERTQQMDAAWTRWEKPILNPGDFVVLLRPCTREERVGSQLYLNGSTTLLTAVDKASRVCLVHRFWAERQERSRHVSFLNGGTDFGSDNDLSLHKFCGAFVREPDREYAYVRSVPLERKHAGHRGPQKSVPVSSIGILDNGEHYLIYRILLFWDGFNIQGGNSASGEGLYMLCLNLPLKARTSANAVRILNLTPPGVKSSTVLNRILQDVVEGATDGFVDYDAYGTKRRIFIDLIGALGNTPALNGALDVFGHTATACCHLCRFIRLGRTSVGSKYGNSVGNGAQSAFKSGYWQHAAIHDCCAQRETCRLMGVKQEANVATLPLHTFREALYRGKDRIRTVNNGQSFLPYHFDPYKASFIAPDHLLSGHLRDCITLVLKLLPSSQHIETCERMIMDLLATVDLPRQNRLIDHSKKGLYTMSMTEVFAVGIVAEHGFLRGCAMLDEPFSASCKSSIDLVGSFARLITDIYHRPELKRDGKMAVKRFEDNDGASNIRKIQRQVQEHMQKVEDLCCMSDDDKDALDEGRGSRERKSELTKIYRTAMTAIRTLDKPNLHRLSEMVHTTLPMVGHMSLIGELVLEKAHQRLKRALKQSNNKQVQLQAMKSVSFDDWQGRLSLISANCFRQNDEALLSCYHLLAGRESVGAMKGQLSEKSKLEVMRALGPEICIAAELHTQGKSVLSPRADALEEGHWTLKGPARRIFFNSRPAQNALDNYVRMAFENYFKECSIFTADSISSKSSTGKPVTCFRRNDVIERLCCLPNEPKFHFPFLLQTNCSDRYSSLEKSSASSLWCILNFLQITTTDGKQLPGLPQFFVSVQPCIADEDLSSEMDDGYLKECLHRFKRYKVDSAAQISFAEIDTSMRKVGIIRAPVSSRDISQVTASSGDSFFALTRDTGYPTRKG